jgi:hypothetical protein
MTDLDVLAFVVWGGGLFNVGFLAGWFAGRRRLRQAEGVAKGLALQGSEPVSARVPSALVSGSGGRLPLGSGPVQTGEESPAFAHLLTQKSAVREIT